MTRSDCLIVQTLCKAVHPWPISLTGRINGSRQTVTLRQGHSSGTLPPPPLPNHCVWVKKYNQNSTQAHSKPNQKYKTPEIKSTHKPGIQSRKPDLQFFPPIPMLKLFILYNVFQCMFFSIFILSSRGKSCYLRQYIYNLKLSECFLHEIL